MTLAEGTPHPSALIGWHEMFMGVAVLASARSKDHRARNGACIVSQDKRILGVGYNGLPRGCDDADPIYWSDVDGDAFHSRHSYVVHAEINATLNCVVHPLSGASIYTTQFPCPRCAQAIIQAGITSVIYLHEKKHHHAENSAAKKMFASSSVQCSALEALDASVVKWVAGLATSIGMPAVPASDADI